MSSSLGLLHGVLLRLVVRVVESRVVMDSIKVFVVVDCRSSGQRRVRARVNTEVELCECEWCCNVPSPFNSIVNEHTGP